MDSSEVLLWSGTFWAVEVFVLAMGLLWLTVRTFDGCFDRIPDRPQGISIQTIVVVILGGMIGAGSLVGAIDCWIEGSSWSRSVCQHPLRITAYFLLIVIGLLLVAVGVGEVGTPCVEYCCR